MGIVFVWVGRLARNLNFLQVNNINWSITQMKKTLIAAAVMAASGVAFAASNVTLYGVIDAGAVVSKVKHNTTKVQMKSGFDSGSRWGIKGVEDLGNGLSLIHI